MKKNILLNSILLFCITILSTGCTITANTDITFDNKDNMKVETTVLFPRELMTYTEDTAQKDLTEDYVTEIDGATVLTDVKKIDNNSGIGNRKIEICKNISRAKKVKTISFIIAQDSKKGILTVRNYLLFKKYIFKGQLATPEKVKSYDSSVNPNGLISSQVRIQVPSQAKGVKANTSIKDVNNPNIYVWKIDYTGVNPIDIEFFMINWYIVSATIVILLTLLFYLIYSEKKKFALPAMVTQVKNTVKKLSEASNASDTPSATQVKQQPVKDIHEKPVQKTPQEKQKPKNTKLVLLILLVLFALAGTGIYFSLPAICNILVDNSIKSVYVGETENATKMIEIANALNFNQKSDISKAIFEKGISEIENNDVTTAKKFFDILAKTNTQNKKIYAKELSGKAMNALKGNQLSKSKAIFEITTKFDTSIPKENTSEIAKKQYELAAKKKYQEALIVSDILVMLDPANPDNHLRHGASLALLGKNKEAVNAYTEALKLKKDFGSAYLGRGLIYAEKLSNEDKAFSDLQQAINLCYAKNELAMAKLNIARIYMKRKNYERVISNACSAEEIFYEIGDMERGHESTNLCYTAICKAGGYCGPLYY